MTRWSPFRKSRAACIGEPIGGYATRRRPPKLKRTTCWRNRCPDLHNFSTSCRLAKNGSAGAAMAGQSLLRPRALHQLHLGSNRPDRPCIQSEAWHHDESYATIGADGGCPRSSLSCPRRARSKPSGPTARTSENMSFSHPTSFKNENQSGRNHRTSSSLRVRPGTSSRIA